MKKLVIPLGLLAAFVGAPASANSNMSDDLAAPYVHLAPANTYTTHYVITNGSAATNNINIKCFDDKGARVGPAAGTSYTAAAHGINVFSPVSLGLTSSPNFDGLGWCYFGSASPIAVTYLMGAADNGNLIPTNNARGISTDTAQNGITNTLALIPYWTQEAGWKSYILSLFPTNNGAPVFKMDVYNTFGALLGTKTMYASTNSARHMDGFNIPQSVATAATFGSARIDVRLSNSAARGFMGWVIGYNDVSNESFQYAIPLWDQTVSGLDDPDRP
jgi:hypothetical protein